MPIFSSLFSACRHAALPVAVLLLSGCAATTSRTPLTVSAAPAPEHGSARIVAYDAYASALITQSDYRKVVVAMATLSATKPEPARTTERPTTDTPVILN